MWTAPSWLAAFVAPLRCAWTGARPSAGACVVRAQCSDAVETRAWRGTASRSMIYPTRIMHSASHAPDDGRRRHAEHPVLDIFSNSTRSPTSQIATSYPRTDLRAVTGNVTSGSPFKESLKTMLRGSSAAAAGLRRGGGRRFALAPAIASLVCIPGFLPQACSGFTMPALVGRARAPRAHARPRSRSRSRTLAHA